MVLAIDTYCKIHLIIPRQYNRRNTTANSLATLLALDATFLNPNPLKLVYSIESLEQIFRNNWVRVRNTRVYRYPSNTNVGYLTLNIPPYVLNEASATHFEVNVDATREAGDDIWFELVDGKTTRPMRIPISGPNSHLPGNIQRPKKLRIYINQSPSNSTIGGTFVT